ncbi:MAG: hypothetical protein LBJ63_09850 [Prevotellaceae bacterium]|jgi:hypothetical protein|nr:hypothetical protein [Prevotellaceae bacterium]
MKYLIIDASLNGTGIRDEYNGGFIFPESLGLSQILINKLNAWLCLYAKEIYTGYTNIINIKSLDDTGLSITKEIKNELRDVKIFYFSDATMKKTVVT